MRTALIAFVLTVVLPFYADARCIWEFECDRWGNCRQVPICDSTLDIVPPRPLAITPSPNLIYALENGPVHESRAGLGPDWQEARQWLIRRLNHSENLPARRS